MKLPDEVINIVSEIMDDFDSKKTKQIKMNTDKHYLKKMFIPFYGKELSDDEVDALLIGNSDETKLFRSFLEVLAEQRKDVINDYVESHKAQVK